MEDLTGQKFGRLTVIGRSHNTKSGKATWICKCDCGKIKTKAVVGYDLKTGKVKSCGCAYFESNKSRNVKHGKTGSRIFNIWQGMIGRCKRNRNYVRKNISVCAEWRSFIQFYNWSMANGYSELLTLDRIDNSKGYNPDNCRWTDWKTQERNRTNNRIITIHGISRTLAEWSEISGIRAKTIAWRNNSGWNEDELLIKPNLANRYIRRKNNGT